MILITFTGCIEEFTQQATTTTSEDDYDETLSIACWNLQIFGPSKAANTSLLSYYAEKLHAYDVFIIQEIGDASGDEIETF